MATAARESLNPEGEREPSIEALYDVLSQIIRDGKELLTPTFSYTAGVIYVDILKVAARHRLRDIDVLEKLSELGALEKEYHDSMVVCPKCGSFRLFGKLKCPNCGSEKLRRISLISHLKCGTVSSVEEMPRAICSKCGERLSQGNSVIVSRLFSCSDCGARFETPLPSYRCSDCGHSFDYREASYMVLYSYRVKKEAAERVAKQLLVKGAQEVAKAYQVSARVSAHVVGKSGYQHPVDMVLSDGKGTVYVDLVPEYAASMSEALSAIAKRSDLAGRHVLVSPKSLENSLQALAVKADVVTYTDAADMRSKLSQLIEEVFKGLARKEAGRGQQSQVSS